MNMPPIIALDRIHVVYKRAGFLGAGREKHALEGVSFAVQRGESIGIIGRNGAGKSTLLRLMAGILLPDAGVFVNRGVSTALLSFMGVPFPECSARDNAIILLMLQQNLSKNEAENLVPRIAAFAGVEHAIDNPVKTFSSGMVGRLKFAIATQADPDVLLIDEVLAVGDMPFIMKCYAAMDQRLERGDTVVFVSHSVVEIANKFSRAIWLERGKIQADGQAKDVVEQYTAFCQDIAE